MSAIDILRIYADEEGCSHFKSEPIQLDLHDYAPPAPSLLISSKENATSSQFLELPVGWYGDWHPTPVRQWLILISGTCEFETGDGKKCVQKAGDVVMLDDIVGKGHQTRVIGNESVRMTAIHFA